MIRTILSVSAMFFAIAAVGAEPDLSECSDEKDDAARLACYDRAAEGGAERDTDVPRAPAAPEQPAADSKAAVSGSSGQEPVAAANEVAEEVDNFGMHPGIAGENKDAPQKLDQIYATVVDIKTRHYGERIITLDNGQVWEEDEPSSSVRLEVGDSVRIKAGSLGSFKLFGSSKRSTKVQRVR